MKIKFKWLILLVMGYSSCQTQEPTSDKPNDVENHSNIKEAQQPVKLKEPAKPIGKVVLMSYSMQDFMPIEVDAYWGQENYYYENGKLIGEGNSFCGLYKEIRPDGTDTIKYRFLNYDVIREKANNEDIALFKKALKKKYSKFPPYEILKTFKIHVGESEDMEGNSTQDLSTVFVVSYSGKKLKETKKLSCPHCGGDGVGGPTAVGLDQLCYYCNGTGFTNINEFDKELKIHIFTIGGYYNDRFEYHINLTDASGEFFGEKHHEYLYALTPIEESLKLL